MSSQIRNSAYYRYRDVSKTVKIPEIGQFTKVNILSRETFHINETFIEALYLLDLFNLFGEFCDDLFHFVFLLD